MVNTKYCTNCTCHARIDGNEVPNPLVGDRYCNDEMNNAACNYDNGDCCWPNIISDHSICYHKETCSAEPHGDPARFHPLVGNGVCNDETNIQECHFDGADCCPNPELIGNGICDDESNIPECHFDEGDCCLDFSPKVCSDCTCYCQDFELVGNRFCNNETNNAECNYDGGECCGPDISCK